MEETESAAAGGGGLGTDHNTLLESVDQSSHLDSSFFVSVEELEHLVKDSASKKKKEAEHLENYRMVE